MFNICKQQEKHVYEITEYDVKDVVNVSVSDMCMQSSPCKHYCTIEFKDGKIYKISTPSLFKKYLSFGF